MMISLVPLTLELNLSFKEGESSKRRDSRMILGGSLCGVAVRSVDRWAWIRSMCLIREKEPNCGR